MPDDNRTTPRAADRTGTALARLWTPEQVAERWGLSPRTLRNWRSLGTGPAFVKAGRAVRYRESDLARWEDSRARESRGRR